MAAGRRDGGHNTWGAGIDRVIQCNVFDHRRIEYIVHRFVGRLGCDLRGHFSMQDKAELLCTVQHMGGYTNIVGVVR